MMTFPEMAVFQQRLASMPIKDAAQEARAALDRAESGLPELSGKSVAVAVGSRRIDRLDTVVGEVIKFLKARGASPFIVAAMGSHGGASAEGQKSLLGVYGITESSMNAAIYADMNTTVVDRTPDGLPVHVSNAALQADHVIPVNRIKPHTKFCGDIESGLCKMLTIGLGNAEGAAACHRFAVRNSFGFIETVAAILLNRLNVAFGVGVIEDGCGKLAR
ncbi:MAG: nickel-dependent lactate racemase, partial [Desulfobacteraceae bacterium]|nr:nickel-dependent lactate racemase [Desulfobacteraceae bacterium]